MQKNNAYYTELYGQKPWWVTERARKSETNHEDKDTQTQANPLKKTFFERVVNYCVRVLVRP